MTLTEDDARHLMRRAGYGALDADVLALTGRIDGTQVPDAGEPAV